MLSFLLMMVSGWVHRHQLIVIEFLQAENRLLKKAPAARKRAGGHSKAARVIAMLERPEGATLQAIVRATGWQTHSVRGFISGHLKKKLGLKVRSSKREGERVYSIRRKS